MLYKIFKTFLNSIYLEAYPIFSQNRLFNDNSANFNCDTINNPAFKDVPGNIYRDETINNPAFKNVPGNIYRDETIDNPVFTDLPGNQFYNDTWNN